MNILLITDMTKSIIGINNLVLVQVASHASIIPKQSDDEYVRKYIGIDKKYDEKIANLAEVACIHYMSLIEMYLHKKEKNKRLSMHALGEKRYICVHGRKGSCTKVFLFLRGMH